MSFGFRSQYDSKENQKRPGTPSESEGRPAAGMKSKVLLFCSCIAFFCSYFKSGCEAFLL